MRFLGVPQRKMGFVLRTIAANFDLCIARTKGRTKDAGQKMSPPFLVSHAFIQALRHRQPVQSRCRPLCLQPKGCVDDACSVYFEMKGGPKRNAYLIMHPKRPHVRHAGPGCVYGHCSYYLCRVLASHRIECCIQRARCYGGS
jgi:hypothetical protein